MNFALKSFAFILIAFSLVLINCSEDPDEGICKELTIDAAVMADGFDSYIFKGDHYWRLDLDKGLSEDFSEKINNMWPGLPPNIDAAFSIDDKRYKKSTVFLIGDKYYYYKGSKQIRVGRTKEWKQFPTQNIDAAFTHFNQTISSEDYNVYFFFGKEYVVYTFQDIDNPKFVAKNTASMVGNFLYFMYNHNDTRGTSIQDTIKIRAALMDKQWLILFGEKNYCKANSTWKIPLCTPKSSKKYFGCPREFRIVPQSSPTTPSSANNLTTSLPHLTERTDLKDQTDDYLSTSKSQQPVEAEHKKESSAKSSSTFLILFIIFFVIVMLAVVVIVGIFVVIKNKKRDTTDSTVTVRSTENLSDPYDGYQRRVKRSASEESLRSLIQKSKSKSSLSLDYDKNEKKSDVDFEKENNDEREEESDDKNEEKTKTNPKEKDEDDYDYGDL